MQVSRYTANTFRTEEVRGCLVRERSRIIREVKKVKQQLREKRNERFKGTLVAAAGAMAAMAATAGGSEVVTGGAGTIASSAVAVRYFHLKVAYGKIKKFLKRIQRNRSLRGCLNHGHLVEPQISGIVNFTIAGRVQRRDDRSSEQEDDGSSSGASSNSSTMNERIQDIAEEMGLTTEEIENIREMIRDIDI